MKKIISAFAAVFICAAMLSACGDKNTDRTADELETTVSESETADSGESGGADENQDIDDSDRNGNENGETFANSEKNPVDDGNEDEDIVPEEEITADDISADDGSESEAEGSIEPKSSFAAMDELAETDISAFAFKQTEAKDSYTYKFINTLESAESFYIDIASADGAAAVAMAFDHGKNVFLTAADDSPSSGMIFIITDMKMYILNPFLMTGTYFSVDESVFEDYNPQMALDRISVYKDPAANSGSVESCDIQIGGRDYIFEYVSSSGGGFLFNTDGTPAAIISNNSLEPVVLMVNEFSENVPAGMFDIPDAYELVDLEQVMAEMSGE